MRPTESHVRLWPYYAVAFAVFFGYGIASSTSQSLFLSVYHAARLPEVWLWVGGLSVVAALLVAACYGRLPLVRIYLLACVLSAAAFCALFVLWHAGYAWAAYALYVLKDVYIVVLSELFWTHGNGRFAAAQAQRQYGLFCAVGSIGTIAGSTLVGARAESFGTTHIFWLIVPSLLATALCVGQLDDLDASQIKTYATSAQGAPARAALGVLGRSRMVRNLVLFVAVVQVAITVMDFQFNEVVTASYPQTDSRAAVLGYIYAAINALSLLLQLANAPILRGLGISGTLLAVPLLLCGACGVQLVLPSFWAMTAVKIWGKSADYSVVRAGKEMLYITLGPAERTHGKALVDILTYRCAKALASLLLWVGAHEGLGGRIDYLSLGLCLVWVWVTLAILREHKRALPSSG